MRERYLLSQARVKVITDVRRKTAISSNRARGNINPVDFAGIRRNGAPVDTTAVLDNEGLRWNGMSERRFQYRFHIDYAGAVCEYHLRLQLRIKYNIMLDVIRDKVVCIGYTYRRSIQYKHVNNSIILHKKTAKYKVKKHFYMHITACKLTFVEYKT